MYIRGDDYLRELLERPCFEAKMVFNKYGAIVFPASLQHREQKAEQISYEDDYKGNALAAMLRPGEIEIRFHKCMADEDVRQILRAILNDGPLAAMRGWRATYQGREVPYSDD